MSLASRKNIACEPVRAGVRSSNFIFGLALHH